MRIRFNESHLSSLQHRDTILTLSARYPLIGTSEYDVPSNTFSGKQLTALALAGVEMWGDLPTFIKVPASFLAQPYGEQTMSEYLAQHNRHELASGEWLLLLQPLGGEHFTGAQIAAFSQYGEVLNTDEYSQYIKNGALQRSLADINTKWQELYTDYKQAKAHMQQLVEEKGGFQALPLEEQRIVAAWFATMPENISQVLTEAEELAAFSYFKKHNTDSLYARWKAFRDYLELKLPTMQGLYLASVIDNYKLTDYYRELGFEGDGALNYKGEPHQSGVIDFLKGQGTYEGKGIASLNLTFKDPNLTIEQVIERGVDIIKFGNY